MRPVVAAYAWLVRRLFPRGFVEDEAAEIVETFRAQCRAADTRWGIARVVLRSFGGLAGAAWGAWRDRRRELRRSPAAGTAGRAGDGPVTRAGGTVRRAARALARRPSFTGSVVALVALGVGSATAILTVVDHALLRPLPYPDPERLAFVTEGTHSGPFLEDLSAVPGVEAWAAAWRRDAVLTGGDTPLLLTDVKVTRDFFAVFGARPARGRLFVDDDFRDPAVAVVSFDAWLTVWGGDPGLVGRSIRVDGSAVRVVGVVEEGFRPPAPLTRGEPDVWTPLDPASAVMSEYHYGILEIGARVRPGASVEDVDRAVADMLRRRAPEVEAYREEDGRPVRIPVVALEDETVAGVRDDLRLLMAAVGVLLLVACANVAHLFLARGLGRLREMSVRRALGADGPALVLQLLAEAVLVGLAGGALGLAGAGVAVEAYRRTGVSAVPGAGELSLDLRVLAFAVAASLVTAVIFGLMPALQATRSDPAGGLREGGRGSTGGAGAARLRGALVVGEVALSLILVAQAILLFRSFAALASVSPGFAVEGVTTVPLSVAGVYGMEERTERAEAIRTALEAVPGVEGAAYGITMPLEFTGGSTCCWGMGVRAEAGPEAHEVHAAVHPVSDGYFDVLGISPVAGRPWAPGEADVTVINAALAVARFGSAGEAVGRTVHTDEASRRVVGVVPDTRHYGPDQDHGPALYVPAAAGAWSPRLHLAVRSRPGQAPPADALREAVWSVDPELPVPVVRSLEEWSARAVARESFASKLYATFGLLALLLAAAGLAGTTLHAVASRRRELGIRLALGEGRRRVERRVLAGGLALGAVGTALGLGVTWQVGRALERSVYGVEADDPVTLAGAAGVLLAVVALSSWLPARRAGRTDPVRVLGSE